MLKNSTTITLSSSSKLVVRVTTSELLPYGIAAGDKLVIQQDLPVKNNSLVVIQLQGALFIKRITISGSTAVLQDLMGRTAPLPLDRLEHTCMVGGVVELIRVIHREELF